MNRRKPSVNIQKGMYHKTKVLEDGITHIVDTEHTYTRYHLSIENDYECDKKDELIKNILDDLKELEKVLENELERSIENER